MHQRLRLTRVLYPIHPLRRVIFQTHELFKMLRYKLSILLQRAAIVRISCHVVSHIRMDATASIDSAELFESGFWVGDFYG